MRHCLKAGIILLFLSFLLPKPVLSQLQKIFLQPKAPGNAKQSKFVDSLHFIPLEIREENKLASYANLQLAGKYFLLIDYNANSILVYAKDGRFVKKISYKKLGDRFYPSYREATNKLVFYGNNKNYTLTSKDLIKIRLDAENPRNKKYFKKYTIDLNDSTLSLQKDSPDENDIVQAFPFYGNFYWQSSINTSPLYPPGQDQEIKIYQHKKLVRSYFPYNRVDEPRFLFANESANFSKTEVADIHYVMRPFSDTIYLMNRDSLKPKFHLVMPMENSIPPTFFTKAFRNKTERENFERNNGWMFRQVYDFYETPDYYYLGVRFQSNFERFVYQKQGNSTYKTRNIKADTSQYNLQLLADINLLREGDKFYKAVKAGDLVKFFEENKNIPVPGELADFISRKPHDAAPVLVQFKFKSTL